jgi:hypothetical protein
MRLPQSTSEKKLLGLVNVCLLKFFASFNVFYLANG